MTEPQVAFGAAEALRQYLVGGLGDHARAGEIQLCARLGDADVGKRGKACHHATGARVGEDRHERRGGLVDEIHSAACLGHLQEGILSLMQMAKTACAVDLINEATSPFVTILADPCTGGVVASFATLADICIAEPGARLYFTGPRVIAETTHEALPEGFGSAERNLELGHLDAVVARKDLRVKIGNYLRLLGGGEEPERATTAAGRARGKGGLAASTLERVRAFAAYARRQPVGGDRQAPDKAEEPPA